MRKLVMVLGLLAVVGVAAMAEEGNLQLNADSFSSLFQVDGIEIVNPDNLAMIQGGIESELSGRDRVSGEGNPYSPYANRENRSTNEPTKTQIKESLHGMVDFAADVPLSPLDVIRMVFREIGHRLIGREQP